MNKLEVWKAQIADIDALKRRIMLPPTSIDEVDYWPAYEEKSAAIDWQAIARALLPIVEAANHVARFNRESYLCAQCGTRNDKHESYCYYAKLEVALKGLEE